MISVNNLTLRSSLERPLTSNEVDNNFSFLMYFLSFFASENGFNFYNLKIDSVTDSELYKIFDVPDCEYFKIIFGDEIYSFDYVLDGENSHFEIFTDSLIPFEDNFLISDGAIYFKPFSDFSITHNILVYSDSPVEFVDSLTEIYESAI
jgi:hypothetical protein